MSRPALCYLVLGASLSVLLHNLAKRRALVPMRPTRHLPPADVIDFAAWKELRNRK